MKLFTATLLIALLVICCCCCKPSQAVVHGIQPISNHYEPAYNNNKNGYRYNGPAHKYLPASSATATEALTTNWHPNTVFSSTLPPEQGQQHQQHQHNQQQQSYNGPYSMQYYEPDLKPSWQQEQQDARQQHQLQQQQYQQHQQHQQHQQGQQQQQPIAHYNNHINTFHKPAATPSTLGQFSTAYGLSAGPDFNRYMETDQLMTQALPEPHQQQLFAGHKQQMSYEQQLGGSDIIQMQSHSFELPSSTSMHRDWPEQQQLQYSQAAQQQYSQAPQQQHSQAAQPQHSQAPQQLSAIVQRPASQYRPEQAYHREESYHYPTQGQVYDQTHNEHLVPQQQQYYMQSNSLPSTSSSSSASSSTQSSHFAQPSREFLAPYY